jgi:hypothetical protein
MRHLLNSVNPRIHRFEAKLFPVNAYLVEGRSGVVAVDVRLVFRTAKHYAQKRKNFVSHCRLSLSRIPTPIITEGEAVLG